MVQEGRRRRSARDEPLFEVSTDKVDSEMPSPASGVLAEILAAEGDTVETGARVAVIDESSGVEPATSAPAPDAPPAASTPEPVAATPSPSPSGRARVRAEGGVGARQWRRRLARRATHPRVTGGRALQRARHRARWDDYSTRRRARGRDGTDGRVGGAAQQRPCVAWASTCRSPVRARRTASWRSRLTARVFVDLERLGRLDPRRRADHRRVGGQSRRGAGLGRVRVSQRDLHWR